ncbi:12952_t:CDS:1, partial [Funneliformis caledonium]
ILQSIDTKNMREKMMIKIHPIKLLDNYTQELPLRQLAVFGSLTRRHPDSTSLSHSRFAKQSDIEIQRLDVRLDY